LPAHPDLPMHSRLEEFPFQASTNWRLLKEEEEPLCGNPCYQQKCACSHSQHDQRAEVVIVWLAAQRSARLHVGEVSNCSTEPSITYVMALDLFGATIASFAPFASCAKTSYVHDYTNFWLQFQRNKVVRTHAQFAADRDCPRTYGATRFFGSGSCVRDRNRTT
jgi:hypothetical protein